MSLAIVLVSSEAGKESELLERLRRIKNVKEAHIVYGVYDIVVKIEARGLDELRDVISRQIRRLEGVRSTITLIVVS